MSKSNRIKASFRRFMAKYPDEGTARKQFEDWRWKGECRCPHCDSLRITKSNQKMPYRCKDCRKRFSVRAGSVMASSNLSFRTWLAAIYIAATGLKETASTKLGYDLGITQKSAWHLGQRLREAWEADREKRTGTVKVEEIIQ